MEVCKPKKNYNTQKFRVSHDRNGGNSGTYKPVTGTERGGEKEKEERLGQLPYKAEDLVKKLLQCVPRDRLAADEALRHECFNSLPSALLQLSDSTYCSPDSLPVSLPLILPSFSNPPTIRPIKSHLSKQRGPRQLPEIMTRSRCS
ncbi:CDK15 kinase, partial [Polyodon spathula]|nr:CDK15 kinase [Polyodon spathula]